MADLVTGLAWLCVYTVLSSILRSIAVYIQVFVVKIN